MSILGVIHVARVADIVQKLLQNQIQHFLVNHSVLVNNQQARTAATGSVCGIKLPEGLKMAQKLPEPIFTPAAKAEIGTHDENISFEKVVEMYGSDVAQKIRDYTLDLYTRASEYAATRGIIIADTKFEFGLDDDKQFLRDWLESTGWNKVPPAPVPPEDIIEKTSMKYREALVKLTGKDVQ